MDVFFIIIYCTVYAVAWTGALIWILERRERKYRQGDHSFTDAFIIGSMALIFVYFSNIVVLIRWPRAALGYGVLLATALSGFGLYRETIYRARAGAAQDRVNAEIRELAAQVQRDPSNPVWFERLSELYEKMGQKERALEAARRAAALDPGVRNAWRLKHLEEEMSAGGKGRGRAA